MSPAEASAVLGLLAVAAVLGLLVAAWLVIMDSLIRRRGRPRWRRRGCRGTVWLAHPNKKKKKIIKRVVSKSKFSENALFETTLHIVTVGIRTQGGMRCASTALSRAIYRCLEGRAPIEPIL